MLVVFAFCCALPWASQLAPQQTIICSDACSRLVDVGVGVFVLVAACCVPGTGRRAHLGRSTHAVLQQRAGCGGRARRPPSAAKAAVWWRRWWRCCGRRQSRAATGDYVGVFGRSRRRPPSVAVHSGQRQGRSVHEKMFVCACKTKPGVPSCLQLSCGVACSCAYVLALARLCARTLV